MSEQLERSAEITKLARLLDVEAHELGYLADVPSTALAAFREQVADRLFGGDAERLKRVAAASKLLPLPLAVKLAQLAFGPMLCAATAGLLEPPRAAKISAKMPVPFLADVATMMDPRRAAAVIAAVPTPVVVAVGRELIGREEYVTMGRFVGLLSRPTLRAAVPAIERDEALLHTAFVLEDKDRLDDLLDVARDRVVSLIHTAYEHDMWAEALDLISHLNLANRAELGDVAAEQDDDLLDSLIRAVQRMGNWDDMLPVMAAMSPASLHRLAELPVVIETQVLRDIVDAALGHEQWIDLLPLTRHLPDPALTQVAARVAEEDEESLGALAEQAHEAGRWDAMLVVGAALPAAHLRRLAALPVLQRDDVLRAAIGAAAEHDLWDSVLPLGDALPDETKPRLASCLGALSREQILAALEAAARSSNLPTLVDIALRQDAAGRERVLVIVAETDQLDEFAAVLTADTPRVVWDALVEVRAEMPEPVRRLVRDRAGELGHAEVVAALDGSAPPQTRPRPRPGPGPRG